MEIKFMSLKEILSGVIFFSDVATTMLNSIQLSGACTHTDRDVELTCRALIIIGTVINYNGNEKN